jgi:Brp/Blh family beta-carotene 15,15'-monooxygenase
MFIFLTTSAYHFGQTQFVGYNFKSLWGSKMIFFIWGGLIFLLLFYFNGNEILALEEVHSQYIPVLEHVILYASYYLVLFASVYFLLSFVLFSTKQQTVSLFFKEFFTLLLVAASMYLFSAFVAFALFFVLMHSLKVMTQEFEYSKNKWSVNTILDFLHLIKPISIVSIAIISFVLIIAYSFQLEHLITYMMIILLSSVTIPHSFVMEKFYDYFVIKNNNLSTSNNPL